MKRKLAVILTVIMILSVFPMGAFAMRDTEAKFDIGFDVKVKEKKITLVYAGAPWCPWTIFNLEGLIPFQEYIESNGVDAQIVAMVHDHQNAYKADILRDYQESSPDLQKEMVDYSFYTVGMNSDAWDHISEIAGIKLKYLPSIFFMNDKGELIRYIQGGDDGEEEQEEEEPVPYNYIEIYKEIINSLEEAEQKEGTREFNSVDDKKP